MYVYMYMYTYIYIYLYIHTHDVYTHTHMRVLGRAHLVRRVPRHEGPALLDRPRGLAANAADLPTSTGFDSSIILI